jgi:hypothetical protein
MLNSLNYDDLEIVEFGVGKDAENEPAFYLIPTDRNVKNILVDIYNTTLNKMTKIAQDPSQYEPSQKYGSREHLYIDINDNMVTILRNLNTAVNLDTNCNEINNIDDIYCYFTRYHCVNGEYITGVKRSTQFKSLINKKRLIKVDDSLRIDRRDTFKLDDYYDCIIDNECVYIYMPSGFEYINRSGDYIKEHVDEIVDEIREHLDYICFDNIKRYAKDHVRAARMLAAINTNRRAIGVEKESLKALCDNTFVTIRDENGILHINDDQIVGFLRVLDRRQYFGKYAEDQIEVYRASSRTQITPNE